MTTLREKPIELLGKQLFAVRAFFTQPKETYTEAELSAIFADDIPVDLIEEGTESTERSRVAEYMLSFMSPVVIGRAAGDLDRSISLETVTLNLPFWLLEGLENEAERQDLSVSDVLAEGLVSDLQGLGVGLDVEIVDYTTVKRTEIDAKAFRHVAALTDLHGDRFVRAVIKRAQSVTLIEDAISDTRVTSYPGAGDHDCPETGSSPCYHEQQLLNAQEEIARRVLLDPNVREALHMAFYFAVTAVLGIGAARV